MKFSCDKILLQNACAVASRAAANKSPIPALEGLLIKAGSSSIRVTGYDLRKGIYTKFDADVVEGGSVVIPARLLGEMLRRMPDGILTLSCDDSYNVMLKCGKNEFNFLSISPEDYPEMPDLDIVNSISLPQSILAQMIEKTIFAVSTSDVRPIYTGTLFEIEDNSLTLVSVDGYRLAKRTETVEDGNLENCSFVVPGTALSDVQKICGDEGNVSICVGAKHISFTIGDTVVISRRLEGEFLNYKKSIPTTFRHELTVARSEFMSSIDRVAIIVNDKNSSPVRINFGDGTIRCRTITAIGKAEDECLCSGDGDGTEIGFNDRYLMDALKAASGSDNIRLCLNTSSSPFIIKAEDGSDGFVYMVLPVRLRAGE